MSFPHIRKAVRVEETNILILLYPCNFSVKEIKKRFRNSENLNVSVIIFFCPTLMLILEQPT
jgi:hypothetical protein